MREELNRLISKSPADKRLTPAVKPPAIRSQTGLEREAGGRIDTSAATFESTDGLFTFDATVVNG